MYDNGAIVGHGYITVLVNGKMGIPVLYDFLGKALEPAWYQLKITEEKHYVVVPKRIQ